MGRALMELQNGWKNVLAKWSGSEAGNADLRERQEDAWILQNLSKVRRDWEEAERRFNEATVPELVDAASYQVMAAQSKYAYFMRRAKEKNLQI